MKEIVYKNNLEKIKTYNTAIGDAVESIDCDINNNQKIELYYSKTGIPIVKINSNGIDNYLNSKYNPEKQVDEWFNELGSIKYSSTFLLFGFGTGLYLKKLVSETPDTVNILVYEPCLDIFKKVIKEIDVTWAFCDNRIIFLFDEINGKGIKDLLPALIYSGNINLFKIDLHTGYEKLYNETAITVMKEVKDFLESVRIIENTQILFADVSAKNLLYGACRIPYNYSINQLKDYIPTDRPAIIIGAGPSLKKNIKELKNAKGRAFLIAVDTALKPLLNENIVPDLYIIVDALKPIQLFEDERIKNTPIVYGCTANSDILRNQNAKIFYFATEAYSSELFAMSNVQCSSLDTGGSVSNSAFSLALLIGIKTIIFVGQDLAYTDNRSHVEGSFSEEEIAVKTKSDAGAMVEDIHGNMVPTQPNMLRFIKWFEDKIEECQKDIKVYDATEGGARIKGTEIIDLKKVIELKCPPDMVDYQKIIEDIHCPFSEEAVKKCNKFLSDTVNTLKKGQRMAKEGIQCYKKLSEMFSKNKIDNNKLLRLQKKISRITTFMHTDPVMGMVIQSLSDINFALLNGIYDVEDDIQDEGVAIAEKGLVMLNHIDNVIDGLIPLAMGAFAKIEK